MSDLKRFRDHAQAMADGGHTPSCLTSTAEGARRWDYFRMFREWLPNWGARPSGPPMPCDGSCVTPADRDLWNRLAREVDDYLSPHPDLFGNESIEPSAGGQR